MPPAGGFLRAPLARSGLFWLFQLGGWALFGAGMLVAGLSVFPPLDALVMN